MATTLALFRRYSSSSASSSSAALPLSPAVRHLLALHKLDAGKIKPSGRNNRILKGDVLAFLESRPSGGKPEVAKKSQPAPSAPLKSAYIDIPHTNIRRVIAERLSASKSTIPHVYASHTVDVSRLVALRKDMLKSSETKFSINDVLIKLAALSLRKVPALNQGFVKGAPLPFPQVDISVAVATDKGLITPIVFKADTLSYAQIALTVKDLSTRAREGKLKPHEFQGGSFSISNLGMFGIQRFQAVINPPQACIMAVGAARPYLTTEGKLSTQMDFSLSFDGRVVNETEAGQWIEVFREYVENPSPNPS